MAISASGIGSGLDVESIITQLMEVESQPLTNIQLEQASYESELSAWGTVKSSLAEFQTSLSSLTNVAQFSATKASISDSEVATVSTSSEAVAGSYSLEVSQLAQAQKLVAAGQSSDITSIGNGTITIDLGTISGGTFDSETGQYTGASFSSSGSATTSITIDSSNNSLSGIRDAINEADIGVSVSIVNDGSDSPYRLVLTSTENGEDGSIKISVSGDAALSDMLAHDPSDDAGQALTETVTAQNAEFELDGIAMSKGSNTVTDAVEGLALNLLETNVDSPVTISVSQNTSSVTASVNSFVSAYNTITNLLDSATAYDAETETAALFTGDSTIRAIQTQIRNILNTPVSGGAGIYTMLADIGVSIDAEGTMSVDSDELESALSENFSDIAALFAATGKASDSLISYTDATDNTQAGAYDVNITQLATQGSAVASGAIVALAIDSSNNTLTVKLDGNEETITLSEGIYTAEALATEIQSKINSNTTFSTNDSSVQVTQTAGVLTLTSERYGSASNISIEGGSGQANLGLGASATLTDGVDVAGTINGVAASGSGQVLTGATGDDSEGLEITIVGGSLGSRGTINYSQGFAYRLDQMLETLLDDDSGVIAARTDGLQSSIDRLEEDQETLSDRLEVIEARYRSQFTALDVLMSQLNATSSYLTQQLASLENLNTQIANG